MDERTHGLGPTRARVLAALQDAGESLTAAQVAGRLGLHPNSARFHLDALVTRGLVSSGPEAPAGPGRPRMRYAATEESPDVTRRRYQLLSEVLAAFVHEQLPDPQAAAEQSGRAWADRMSLPEEAEPLDVLVAGLDEVGFDSRVVAQDDSPRIEVSHCPFLEVAERHDDVVCALHLGLMRGLLERLDAPVAVAGLEPLVEPGLCVARLTG